MWNKPLDFNEKKTDPNLPKFSSHDYEKNLEYARNFIQRIESNPENAISAYLGSSDNNIKKRDVLHIKFQVFKSGFSCPVSLNENHIHFKNSIEQFNKYWSSKLNNLKSKDNNEQT